MDHLDNVLDTGQILISQEQLYTRIRELAEKITKTYLQVSRVDVIVILNGAKQFTDDLFAIINDPKFKLHYIKTKSYNGTVSNGDVEAENIAENLSDSDVLIIDDIYDSGRTLKHISETVNCHNPNSIKICALLEKQIEHNEQIYVDFKGFDVPDDFLIGYGLDYNGQFRELPFIAAFNPKNTEA